MKLWIVASYTNYDLMVHIVSAPSKWQAEKLAMDAGAWSGCDIEEIEAPDEPGIVTAYGPSGKYENGFEGGG